MDLANIRDVKEDGAADIEDFDIEGFTQEEIRAYNSIAEPGQSLGDAATPMKMRDMMYEVPSRV